mmetsp:Transcript_39137/g.62705  ORF Transcript_39137/g.62705 Transcript_39137/m.62705 type:complete len:86 (-) Transcript_39137:11-268(-)
MPRLFCRPGIIVVAADFAARAWEIERVLASAPAGDLRLPTTATATIKPIAVATLKVELILPLRNILKIVWGLGEFLKGGGSGSGR